MPCGQVMLLAARPDFGFGNPNLAAALFAMLAVAAWRIPAPEAKRWLDAFWISLGVCAVFSCVLVSTASRGGMVALFGGLVACWAAAGFPRTSVARTIGVSGAAGLVLAMAVSSRLGERAAASSFSEGSIAARTDIWREFPAMLAASPRGWGQGKAADAYENWFQRPEDTRTYKHLVSTHATWMAERGWGFRFAYVLALSAALLICWAVPGAFGILVAFLVAGIFSHVGADWRLWILPGASFAYALACRARMARWPNLVAWGCCLAFAFFSSLLLWAVGSARNKGISHHGWGVVVGDGDPETWIFSPSAGVLGKSYGKPVRALGSACVAWQIERVVASRPKKIVLSGDTPLPPGESFAPPYDLVWLNPPAVLSQTQRQAVELAEKKTVVWGELRTDGRPGKLKAWIEALPQAKWKFVPGKALFLGKIESEQ